MKKCKYCKEEIDAKAKICPHCRKTQGSSILRVMIGVFIGLALIILSLKYCDYIPEVYVPTTKNILTGNTENDNFTHIITSSKSDEYNIGYYIEGIVTNNTSNNYSYVQIQFSCYDKDGINLGTAMDNVNNISSYEKWKFKATGLFDEVEKVDHCDFKDITAW